MLSATLRRDWFANRRLPNFDGKVLAFGDLGFAILVPGGTEKRDHFGDQIPVPKMGPHSGR